MKQLFLITTLLCSIGLFSQKAVPKTNVKETSKVEVAKAGETIIEITTDFGVMTARLYNSTPLHRDNFIKLMKQGFYDSLLFHRVINGFMIQGGDPTSKRADSIAQLGAGEIPGTPTIPAEFRNNLIHKKGALAAARDGNPEKKSSNCQFYIVQGKKTDSTQLNNGVVYTKDQKEIYQRIGGTPFLDQNYTVFGEVFIGMDAIDKIAATKVYDTDRPVKNVRMKIKILN
jgi:peptidyl-prolyl cis-trans isomerase B (cyclophilin B)